MTNAYFYQVVDFHLMTDRVAMVSPRNSAWMYFRFSLSCLSFSLAGSCLVLKGNRRKNTVTKMVVIKNSPKQYLYSSSTPSTWNIQSLLLVQLSSPINSDDDWHPWNTKVTSQTLIFHVFNSIRISLYWCKVFQNLMDRFSRCFKAIYYSQLFLGFPLILFFIVLSSSSFE